jgi:hypothetical protein
VAKTSEYTEQTTQLYNVNNSVGAWRRFQLFFFAVIKSSKIINFTQTGKQWKGGVEWPRIAVSRAAQSTGRLAVLMGGVVVATLSCT